MCGENLIFFFDQKIAARRACSSRTISINAFKKSTKISERSDLPPESAKNAKKWFWEIFEQDFTNKDR